MGIRWERKAVLAKLETVYADGAAVAAGDAVLLKNVDVNTLNGERIPRDVLRLGYGNQAGWLVGRHVTLTARIDLAGSGTAGTAPAFGKLLRMCGVGETVTPGTSVAYASVNSGWESGSLSFAMDGTRSKIAGARGNAKLRFNKNRPPEIELSLIGLWEEDTATAFPTQTLTAWKDPQPSTKANTPTYTIDSQAVAASSLELDFGMDLTYLERINRQEILVRDRRPKLTTLIEELPLGTKNFFAMAGGAPVALSYVHGIGAGNICSIAIAAMQIQDAPRQEEETETMLNLSANILIGAPDFSITFT
jgi:hypothetical protein